MIKGRNAPFRVLICDDDPGDRWLIRAYLQQQTDREITFVEAGETSEIQAAVDQGTVELVLMDIDMPDKSGLYWLRQIVENQLAPVVMLTGHGSEEMAVQSLQQGAVGYLPKSNLSREQLIDTIDRAMEKWRAMQRSRADKEELERLATVDSLTGLLNRRATLQKLEESMTRARRYGEKLCVLLMDIDNFKQINDTYGHVEGDTALRNVAALVQRRIRDADTVGRYGGDEFLIILPHTELAYALIPAERIRKAIEALRIEDATSSAYSMTVSLGIASYEPGDDTTSIIHRADNGLYRAKQEGRNRIEV